MRTRHPGAARSAGRTRYNLGKARKRLGNGRSLARSRTLGPSRLRSLAAGPLSTVGEFLTGKKGTLEQQVKATGNNVRKLSGNLSLMRGARRTRRLR